MAYNPLYRGKISRVQSRSLSTGYENGTLSGILAGTPVSVDNLGKLVLVDVSSDPSASKFVGLTAELIPSAASGLVYSGGRAEVLTSALTSFAIGDELWIGKDGFLTNIGPSIGVGGFVVGDWVILIGTIVKNEFNPADKDIQMRVEIVGKL